MEEAAINAGALEDAHGARVAIGQDRFRAGFGGGGLEARCYFVERVVPGDAGEAAFALRAGATERVKKAVGRVLVFEIAGYFGTEETLGNGVGWVATEATAAAGIVDVNQERAGVGAIESADGVDGSGHDFIMTRNMRIVHGSERGRLETGQQIRKPAPQETCEVLMASGNSAAGAGGEFVDGVVDLAELGFEFGPVAETLENVLIQNRAFGGILLCVR